MSRARGLAKKLQRRKRAFDDLAEKREKLLDEIQRLEERLGALRTAEGLVGEDDGARYPRCSSVDPHHPARCDYIYHHEGLHHNTRLDRFRA